MLEAGNFVVWVKQLSWEKQFKCNVSTKVISKTKLLMRDLNNRKNYFAQKHDYQLSKNVQKYQRNKLQWPTSAVSNFSSYIKTTMKRH